MARKFLYLVAVVIVLVIIGMIALSIWSREATEIAFVPRGEFVEQEALAANAYEDPDMWYSRPGLGTNDPSRYQPAIAQPASDPADQAPSPDSPAAEQSLDEPGMMDTKGSIAGEMADAQATPGFAVFFVPPTSFLKAGGTEWNAALDDAATNSRARTFLRGLASPFNRADEIWAPKYRQAAAGAFLTDKPEAQRAIDAAYADVLQAFDYFLESVDEGKPIVLAGHSQGANHVLRLLMDRAEAAGITERIVAVYAIGWPISVEHDLPALPLPACASAQQAGCIIAYSAFSDGGDPEFIKRRYEATPGLDGAPRGDGPILCVNPLTGSTGGSAPASANLGTLKPSADLASGELVPGAIPARCNEDGLLLIGDPPQLGEGVLPGGNYHVYDIPLFWKNLQEDVLKRVNAWTSTAA
ncbi:DUF3089 domain-containing protein [Qipengyuania sp. 1NDH17]|uniref:DUF3089 domain-containing protein n=1 Tax=Qipengyuania polymorpha TaxID=2867234 RepID=A0ABS7ITV9_9SPHN|nr:DUF3089 domain-containing protein [Qipengyuania polymorpha]MBX7456798.1 DUF3089 domain-containing protein [Qipengyuania polymorpha]